MDTNTMPPHTHVEVPPNAAKAPSVAAAASSEMPPSDSAMALPTEEALSKWRGHCLEAVTRGEKDPLDLARTSASKIPPRQTPTPPTSAALPTPSDNRKRKCATPITLQDCHQCIINALAQKRINHPKALRLRECLDSDSPFEIIHRLLCEQIPQKRSREQNGYQCRLCVKPLRGHVCPYCPVCSTPKKTILRDGNHACFNCPQCFEAGRKKKKLIQVRIGEGSCPHGDKKRDDGAAILLGFSQGK